MKSGNSKNISVGGGWLVALLKGLIDKPDIEMHVSYVDRNIREVQKYSNGNVYHYAIPRKVHSLFKYDKSLESHYKQLITEINPDIIHIHGTENTNALAAIRSCPERLYVVSIQGLISRISEHYHACIPLKYQKDLTIRDILNQDGAISKGRKLKQGSKYEIEILEKVKYVMGRTTWDKACLNQINPTASYYKDTRVLRKNFYENTWSLEKCQRYSIFMSQSASQIKGLHFILKALPYILKSFPNTHLFVAGMNISRVFDLRNLLSQKTYWFYIRKLIKEYNLQRNVTFLGNLNSEEMCNAFLNSHVFVLSSCIENSPNALSEALALGVPSVASFVGGVADVISHNENGFLYPFHEYYMMAHYICNLFENDELCMRFSQESKSRASEIFSKENNVDAVYNSYLDILKKERTKNDNPS